MMGHDLPAPAGHPDGDAAHPTMRLAAACELVALGVAPVATITVARSDRASAVAQLADRIAADHGVEARVELGLRAITIRIGRAHG